MTILTIENPVKLSKTHFLDLEELFMEYARTKNIDLVELWIIDEDKISKELKEKIVRANSLSESDFTDI